MDFHIEKTQQLLPTSTSPSAISVAEQVSVPKWLVLSTELTPREGEVERQTPTIHEMSCTAFPRGFARTWCDAWKLRLDSSAERNIKKNWLKEFNRELEHNGVDPPRYDPTRLKLNGISGKTGWKSSIASSSKTPWIHGEAIDIPVLPKSVGPRGERPAGEHGP
jgi:hypothetical protein